MNFKISIEEYNKLMKLKLKYKEILKYLKQMLFRKISFEIVKMKIYEIILCKIWYATFSVLPTMRKEYLNHE